MGGIIAQKARRRGFSPPPILTNQSGLVMLVLFMLLVFVAPFPILVLTLLVELLKLDVSFVPRVQPSPVQPILMRIPIVVILPIGIVVSVFPFFLFPSLVIVLRYRERYRPDRRQQGDR